MFRNWLLLARPMCYAILKKELQKKKGRVRTSGLVEKAFGRGKIDEGDLHSP